MTDKHSETRENTGKDFGLKDLFKELLILTVSSQQDTTL